MFQIEDRTSRTLVKIRSNRSAWAGTLLQSLQRASLPAAMSSTAKYLSASRRSSVNELCSFVGATRAQSVTLLENFNWNVAVRACLLLFILVLLLLFIEKALLQVFFATQVPEAQRCSSFTGVECH